MSVPEYVLTDLDRQVAEAWLVNRYLGMTEADTLKTWTVMETILGVVGFAIVAVLFVLIA